MRVAILSAAMMLAAVQVNAQQVRYCGPHEQVVKALTGAKYGEVRQGVGVANNGGLVEVFSNPVTGSWTIIATMPNQLTCLMASGTAWESNPSTPGEGT